MFKFLLLLSILLSGCTPAAIAQVQVTQDTLPNTNSSDSTAVLNNNLRLNQNAINAIGGYFNANGYLQEANGGTGANLATFANGSILIQNSSSVGIGTFGQGTAGFSLVSNGPNLPPSWGGHGAQFFSASGTFTAPTGVTTVFLTMIGGGSSGKAGSAIDGGGGAGGQYVVNYPYTVVAGNAYTVTVGAGGAGGISGTTNAGGDTTFDAFTVLGAPATNTTAGALSYGSGMNAGTAPSAGTQGLPSGNGANSGGGKGGGGGGSPFGSGGAGTDNLGTAGQNGTGFGTGGGGGGTATQTSGSGKGGFILVQW